MRTTSAPPAAASTITTTCGKCLWYFSVRSAGGRNARNYLEGLIFGTPGDFNQTVSVTGFACGGSGSLAHKRPSKKTHFDRGACQSSGGALQTRPSRNTLNSADTITPETMSGRQRLASEPPGRRGKHHPTADTRKSCPPSLPHAFLIVVYLAPPDCTAGAPRNGVAIEWAPRLGH
jgi:hypothetical protein